VTATCLVAVLLVVGFTAAPTAAAEGTGVSFDGDGVSVDVGDDVSVDAGGDGVDVEEDVQADEEEPDTEVQTPDAEQTAATVTDDDDDDGEEESDNEFPEEVCTDVPEEANGEVPYSELPWVSDLPEEAQPPGVPTDIVTPEAVAGIAVGATPNQCEVQDPNDPSYDPRDGEAGLSGDITVSRLGEYEGGGVALVFYEATVDDSNDGPGVAGYVGGLGTSEFGDADAEVMVNDGEKDYGVAPRVRYQDNGTTYYAENDVRALNSRLGVEVDCNGEECQPGTRGLPQFVEAPAIPAPTGDDGEEESDNEFPEEVCTDVPEEANGEVPYSELPWVSDLPEEAQPPGVPTDIVTPEAVAGIAVGATPNQCEVQDPNDPSYDPRDGEAGLSGDITVSRLGEYEGGGVALVFYEATVDDSNDGPGVAGYVGGLGTSEFGDADAEVMVNDGEKDYGVAPRVRYQDNGTTYYAENDVRALNSRLGVEVDCNGEECQPGTRGLPQFVEAPAIPAPTSED